VAAAVTMPTLAIDLAVKTVKCEGEVVRLAPTEWSFLEILVRHSGQLVSQNALEARATGLEVMRWFAPDLRS